MEEFEPKEKKRKKVMERNKAQEILDSNMPKWKKDEYLEQLGKVKQKKSGIPFPVYAKIKKIPQHLHKAMLVFPKAKGVELASLEEWDQIFKNF